MSKTAKLIIIIVAAIVLLGGGTAVILLTAPDTPAESSSSAETIYAFSCPVENFVSAAVTNGKSGYTLNKTDNGYTLEEAKHLTLDDYYVKWVSETLCGIKAVKRISEVSDDLSQYGLAQPAAQCLLTLSDGGTETFYVGSEAPTGGSYMSVASTGEVFVVISSLPSYLQNSAAWFVDVDVIPSADDYTDTGVDTAVKRLAIGGAARSEVIEIGENPDYDEKAADETSSAYKLFRPIEYDINTTTVADLISYAQSVAFTECVSIDVSAQSLKAFGLDSPDYTLNYTFADTEVDLIFAETGEGYMYAMLKGVDAVFTAYPTYTSFLDDSADSYMSRIAFGRSVGTVDSITVRTADNTWRFTVSHTESGILPYFGSLALDVENFKVYYEALIMTLSEGRADETATAAPYLSIIYSFNDGTADVVTEFVPISNLRYVYLVNGEGIFYVLKSQVDSVISDTAKVAANESIKATI